MKISFRMFTVIVEALALEGQHGVAKQMRASLDIQGPVDQQPWRTEVELDHAMCLAQTLSGDPGCGLVVGTSLAQMGLGTLATMLPHAPSLRVMLDDTLRYAMLQQDGCELAYSEDGSQCVLCFTPLGTTPNGLRFRTEQLMCALMMMLRFCGAADADMGPIRMTHARPAYAARYAPIFGPTLRFGQPRCEIAFAAALLDQPQAFGDAQTYQNLRRRAEAERAARLGTECVVQALGKLLMPTGSDRADYAPPGDMGEAARRLRMSARTLRRQLAEAGTSYSAMLEDSRLSTAQHLLLADEIPIKQIAETVGYANTSSLHRAFRRATGMTPLQWRGEMRRARSAVDVESLD